MGILLQTGDFGLFELKGTIFVAWMPNSVYIVSNHKLTTAAHGSGVFDSIIANMPAKNTKYSVSLKVACLSKFRKLSNAMQACFAHSYTNNSHSLTKALPEMFQIFLLAPMFEAAQSVKGEGHTSHEQRSTCANDFCVDNLWDNFLFGLSQWETMLHCNIVRLSLAEPIQRMIHESPYKPTYAGE